MKKIFISFIAIFLSFNSFADEKIRVVTSKTEHFSPAGLMPEFCKTYGLDVSVSQKTPTAYDQSSGGIPLLERGDFDIAGFTLPSGLIARANGVPIYMIANMATNGIDFIVKSDVKGYKDLKGKTIGQLRGSASAMQIERKLKEAGLNFNDIKFQYMSYEQMPIAFDQGIIDGYVGSYPFTLRSLNAGGISIDSFPDVVRPLYATEKLSKTAAESFKKCHKDLYKFISNAQNKPAVQKMIDNAKQNGLIVNVPADVKYSYKLTSTIADKTVEDTLNYLKAENKISKDFNVPVDFNRTQ